jgi:transposase-like protein
MIRTLELSIRFWPRKLELRCFSDSRKDRMKMHKNARLTPLGREQIVRQVESGQTPEAVSEAAGVCPRTVRKWVERFRREGLAGLEDRLSRPHRLRPTPQTVIEEIE